MNERHALIHHFLRETALFYGIVVILANYSDAAIQRRLFHLFEQHGNARIGTSHRDSPAHSPRADDGGLADVVGGRLLGDIGDLRNRAFGEKRMNERASLIGSDALFEDLALFFATFVKRQ